MNSWPGGQQEQTESGGGTRISGGGHRNQTHGVPCFIPLQTSVITRPSCVFIYQTKKYARIPYECETSPCSISTRHVTTPSPLSNTPPSPSVFFSSESPLVPRAAPGFAPLVWLVEEKNCNTRPNFSPS